MADFPRRYVKVDIWKFFGAIRISGHHVSVHRNRMISLLNMGESAVDPKHNEVEAPNEAEASTTSKDDDDIQVTEPLPKEIKIEPMVEAEQPSQQSIPKKKEKKKKSAILNQG
ncbi:hypothetical protein Aduo_018994 [Ancylostoma duodenale]